MSRIKLGGVVLASRTSKQVRHSPWHTTFKSGTLPALAMVLIADEGQVRPFIVDGEAQQIP